MADCYVAYLRVSTDKQGKSGLGLEAQQKSIVDFVDSKPDASLLEEFVEIESGKKNDRPKLQEAISYCKRHKATLLIAKLDRLARNVHFISGLMEANVDFLAVDCPHANKLMLHLLAAFAEHEREVISQRTKDALAQAKVRGVLLGKNGQRLAEQNKILARERAIAMRPILLELQLQGFITIRTLTTELNRRNIPSSQGRRWHLASVSKLVNRLDLLLL